MKAIVYTKYRPPDVLQLKEIAKPEPKEDQVLVKVRAASVNALDYLRFAKLATMGRLMEEQFIKSVGKALGADLSGVVDAVGANAKQFQPGDEIDRCYPLSEVSEAIRYLVEEHAQGKAVITVHSF